MNQFKETKLLKDYSVKNITLNEYNEYRSEFEPKIFFNRFDLNINEAYSDTELNNIKKLEKNLESKQVLRLGFFYKQEMIGWFYGIQISKDSFRMGTVGIINEHQRKGVYSAFLEVLFKFIENEGYQKIQSRHYATDNQVIIPTLRSGFKITGMELTDDFGLLVLVTYFFNQTRQDAIDMRSGFSQASPEVKKIIRKY
jgi:hypothetical protein